MSSSYGALLARPGARSVALACAVGWLSFCSYGLAIVLAVESATASFGAAGVAVAVFALGSSALAPMRGRLVDRHGPVALLWLAPVHALALGVLAVGCARSAGMAVAVLAAGIAGASAPPVIATARSVWPQVTGPQLAQAGHAVTAALGDAGQVLGPPLAAGIAAAGSPVLALALLVPGAPIGAAILARHGRADVGASARAGRGIWGVLGAQRGLRTLAACELAAGVWVGALDVVAPAVAQGTSAAELGALPLAAFAAGSIVLSLASGAGRVDRPAAWRYVAGSVGIAVVLPLCVLTPTLSGLTAVAVVAGAGFGLLNVALFELLDEVVPSTQAVEALTWLTSAQGAGMALGSTAAGLLAHDGARAMALVLAGAAAAGAALAVARRRTLGPALEGR